MDADEEFADATLQWMIREIRPEWNLREAAPADEGTDAVYFVTVETPDGRRECVLKVCEFLDPKAFRPEPYLMALIDRRTSIPVPRVVGAVDDHDDLPAPFFLMDRLDGEVRENDARDLPAGAVERLARDAGRNLAEVHSLGDFEAFGPIRLPRHADRDADPDADRGGTGVAVDGRTLTVGEAGVDSWRAHFERVADANFADLHDRFADLDAPLRAFVEDRLDALDREFAPVLGHDDYRLGNLLADPATGETKAVLDWGNAHTTEVQYNLVLTEQYFSGWAPRDDPLRERVRAALREGYETTNELPRDPDFERRRELYLAVTRLFPMVWFSLWYGDGSEGEREERADSNRQAARELLD
jgi:aminoglycoside phosphotransferase (APT) family kinase protein